MRNWARAVVFLICFPREKGGNSTKLHCIAASHITCSRAYSIISRAPRLLILVLYPKLPIDLQISFDTCKPKVMWYDMVGKCMYICSEILQVYAYNKRTTLLDRLRLTGKSWSGWATGTELSIERPGAESRVD